MILNVSNSVTIENSIGSYIITPTNSLYPYDQLTLNHHPMTFYFGPLCNLRLEPSSPPFAVYRNKHGHTYSDHINQTLTKKHQFQSIALNKTLYYKQCVSDIPVPGDILQDCILEDTLLDKKRSIMEVYSSRNTVLGFHHECRSYVVHAAGEGLTELIVRNVSSLIPAAENDSPGFILPTGNASIQQLERFGTGSFNTSSEILARTSSEIFHLKSLELTDHLPSRIPRVMYEFEPPAVILEPVQKWETGWEIACMSGSKSAWSHGLVINKCTEEMFTLSSTEGIQAASNGSVFRNDSSSASNGVSDFVPINVETTLHPQVSYLSRDSMVFSRDLRASGSSNILFESPFSVLSLHALSSGNPNLFFVGVRDSILLMDARYTKGSVTQRPVADEPHMFRGDLNAGICSDTNIFVSGGARSKHIFAHAFSSWDSEKTHTDSTVNISRLLCASSESGIDGCVSWDITGYPVIDRSSDFTLRGMDMVRVSEGTYSKDVVDSYSQSSPHTRRQSEARNDQRGEAFMLIQQSDTGDVYAQHIVEVPREHPYKAPVQIDLPLGVRCPAFTEQAYADGKNKDKLLFGMGIGDPVCDEDRDKNVYPLGASNFSPVIRESDLKKFTLLKIDLDDLSVVDMPPGKKTRGKIIVSKRPLVIDSVDELKNSFQPFASKIQNRLRSVSTMTLFEIWHFLSDNISAEFDVEVLRKMLDIECSTGTLVDVEPYLLQYSMDLIYGSSDGFRVVVDERFTSNSRSHVKGERCTCHIIPESISDSMDCWSAVAHGVHLYSQAREVMTCCNKPTCLLPHLIVYRIKQLHWPMQSPDVNVEDSLSQDIFSQSSYNFSQDSWNKTKKNTMSDVTTDIISSLKEAWNDNL